jgi:prophage regulatory protein
VTDNVLLRVPAVLARTGMKSSTLYQAINRGDFPSARKIGMRAVAWREADVDAWINARPPAVAFMEK